MSEVEGLPVWDSGRRNSWLSLHSDTWNPGSDECAQRGSMRHPRDQKRTSTRTRVSYRIAKNGKSAYISEPADGEMRELSIEGLAMDTSHIKVDGLHISYNDHPGLKNRLHLRWQLPHGRLIKAIGETVWYERLSATKPVFVVGLRFLSLSKEDMQALRVFLESAGRGRLASVEV
jgi:hypothetical protein